MRPPEPGSRLLEIAGRDLRAAKLLLHALPPEHALAGFHLQQAAEKIMKHMLLEAGLAPPRTHDLSLLAGLLEDSGIAVPNPDALARLNPFAVQFRYDFPFEDPPDPSPCLEVVELLLAKARDASSSPV